MKKIMALSLTICSVSCFTACNFSTNSSCEHIYKWKFDDEKHYKEYICGCKIEPTYEQHFSNDGDNFCDICESPMFVDYPAPTNHFLRNQAGCEWLNEIRAEDIAEIKLINEAVGVAPGTLKNIQSSTDAAVIARLFDEYYWLDVAPILKADGQIDGGSAVTVRFILKDGTERKLYINNGNYRDTSDNYFDLLYTPKFEEDDNAAKTYGFITYNDTGVVYRYEDYPDLGEKVGVVGGIGQLEFIQYVWSAENLPSHGIVTEFGTLKIYDYAVFYYNGADYLVVNDDFNFYKMFTEADGTQILQ